MGKENSKGKFQFVFLNLEGDEETIQEAVRQAGVILNRGMAPPPPTRTLIAVPVQSQKELTAGNQNGSMPAEQVFEVVEAESQSANDGVTTNATLPAAGAKQERKKRVPRTPKFLDGFDQSEADVSLEEFAKQKDTSSHYTRYLVIATWFKNHYKKATDEISTSHIYTCYKLLGWQAPDDMGLIFRAMKAKHDYFDNGSKNGLWKIKIYGLNTVDKMTAKTEE